MRLGGRSRAVACGKAGQLTGDPQIEERVSSPDGQVSGMAGSEQRSGTCVACRHPVTEGAVQADLGQTLQKVAIRLGRHGGGSHAPVVKSW
jgi:hypothetical protein